MPRFVSKDGVWYPAKEKVSLVNKDTGEPYIYEGPDRAAEFELFLAKQETFGVNFKDDPDLIERARQRGYKSVLSFAKAMGYDSKKAQEEFDKHAAEVTKHELPPKKEAIATVGGGMDRSGQGEDFIGGFGKESLRKAK